jgi:DNA-binding NtrC family response regulator
MAKILIVDDEPNMLTLLEGVLHRDRHAVVKADSGPEALRLYTEQGPFDVVISDLVMPQMNGQELFLRLKTMDPCVPFIMLTGVGTIKTAVEMMRDGAFDFLTKSPFDRATLRMVVKKAVRLERVNFEGHGESEFAGMIGQSDSMKALFRLIVMVAKSDMAVLVQGESGTGKELVAKAIHFHSSRRDKAFVALDCGAMPETLLESELFGHLRGSFTGAYTTKKGMFEQADGGTILLDEITNTSLSFQAKLLRALQEGEIRQLGSNTSIKVNFRLIALTNQDLKSIVKAGNFRDDLYFRLAVMPVVVPALRERKEDIPILVKHFVDKHCAAQNKPILDITQEAMEVLISSPWYGNVRELENMVKRAVLLCQTTIIDANSLSLVSSGNSQEHQVTLKQRRKEAERERIMEAIVKNAGNKRLAANDLGISLASLYNKINEYHLDGTWS